VKLDPIDPQEFTDYVAYSEKKRTRGERFLDKIKPRSAAMRTTVLVGFVVLFSLVMSLWFFWRTLYLPEIQQHARYLAVELEIINNPKLRIFHDNVEMDIDAIVLGNTLAMEGGLNVLKDAIYYEPIDQSTKMNVNILATAADRQNDPVLQKVGALYHTAPVKQYIQEKFGGTKVDVNKPVSYLTDAK